MHRVKRVFALPGKLVDAFACDLKRRGHILEWAMAAALCDFLEKSPADRDACFDRYHAYAREHLGDDCDPRKRRTGGPRRRRSTLRPYRDRNAAMCLKIPPPDKQMTIG